MNLVLICLLRKLTSDNLARAEFEVRKLERAEARERERLYREKKEEEAKEEKEKKDKEQKEERKREREREDRRDQLTQMFQVQLINSLHQRSEDTTSGLQLDQVTNIPQKEMLEINLKMKNDDDSESYPAKVFASSFDEFVTALCDFCSLDQSSQIKVILFRMNRIMDLTLLELGRTYLVEWKKKDGYSKVYLD